MDLLLLLLLALVLVLILILVLILVLENTIDSLLLPCPFALTALSLVVHHSLTVRPVWSEAFVTCGRYDLGSAYQTPDTRVSHTCDLAQVVGIR